MCVSSASLLARVDLPPPMFPKTATFFKLSFPSAHGPSNCQCDRHAEQQRVRQEIEGCSNWLESNGVGKSGKRQDHQPHDQKDDDAKRNSGDVGMERERWPQPG